MEQTIELFGMKLKVVEDDNSAEMCPKCVFHEEIFGGCHIGNYKRKPLCANNKHFELIEDE